MEFKTIQAVRSNKLPQLIRQVIKIGFDPKGLGIVLQGLDVVHVVFHDFLDKSCYLQLTSV